MYTQLTNTKDKKLFILTITSTNDIKPNVKVHTWERSIELFNCYTSEEDNDRYFSQVIQKEIRKDSAEALMRCNRKGWGSDFFKYLTIEPLPENKFNK